jgi:hypothetical protein
MDDASEYGMPAREGHLARLELKAAVSKTNPQAY